MLVATFLIGSAVLRVGSEAGQAFARQNPEPPVQSEMGAAPQACEPPEDLRRLLEVFKEREARIEKRESDIRNRLHALAVADEKVSGKLVALETAEEKLRATIALAEVAAEDDLSRLTTVYETMKPKDAALLFEEMDPEFAAGFIGRMRPEIAAGVMAGLSPQAAYTISVVLAGRNAEVPTE
ncbi:hypothetical protein [Shimia sp.]|uniref:MotE family protein n=1 Tax=Shimia sp. TaxID=1954381 RepID=UPI003297A7F8